MRNSLQEEAYEWAKHTLEREPDLMNNFDEFKRRFNIFFGTIKSTDKCDIQVKRCTQNIGEPVRKFAI
jgi:hypothetical protein